MNKDHMGVKRKAVREGRDRDGLDRSAKEHGWRDGELLQ